MRIKRTIAGILALCWMCVIFSFSAQVKEESSAVSEAFSYQIVSSAGTFFHLHLDEEEMRLVADSIGGFVRKMAHMTEYAMLSVLLYIWLGTWQPAAGRRCLMAIFLAVLYAASDEIHQLFVPGRAGTLRDVLIDGTGAILGVFIFIGVKKCISFSWNRREYRAKKLS